MEPVNETSSEPADDAPDFTFDEVADAVRDSYLPLGV